jgi:hypothetical protein
VCRAIVSYAPRQVTMVYHCGGPAVHLAMLCELEANATLRCAALTYLVQTKKPSLIGEVTVDTVRHFAFAMDPREDIFQFVVPFSKFNAADRKKLTDVTLAQVAWRQQFADFEVTGDASAVAPKWGAPRGQLSAPRWVAPNRQFTTEPLGVTYKNVKMAFVETDPACAIVAIDADLPRSPGVGCIWLGRGAELQNIGRASKLEARVPDARRAEWDAAQIVIRDAAGGCEWFAWFASRMLLDALCDETSTSAKLGHEFRIARPVAWKHMRDVIESAILPILATADEPGFLVARRALVQETRVAPAPLFPLRQRLAFATTKIRKEAQRRGLSQREIDEWTVVAQSFIAAQRLGKQTDSAAIAARIANEDPDFAGIDVAGIMSELADPNVGPVIFEREADAAVVPVVVDAETVEEQIDGETVEEEEGAFEEEEGAFEEEVHDEAFEEEEGAFEEEDGLE